MKKTTWIILTSICVIEIIGLLVLAIALPTGMLAFFVDIYHSFGATPHRAFYILEQFVTVLWLLPIIDGGLLVFTALYKKKIWFFLLMVFVLLQILMILIPLYSGFFACSCIVN